MTLALRKEICDLREQLKRDLFAFIYISKSENRIIFTPARYVGYGVEQDDVTVVPYDSPLDTIGQAAFSVLLKYRVETTNGGRPQLTEWPSYKASHQKTKKAFEKKYTYAFFGNDARMSFLSNRRKPGKLKTGISTRFAGYCPY